MAYKTLGSSDPAAATTDPMYRPSGVLTGDITIYDLYDALFYGEITAITGTLTIAPGYFGGFELPKLVWTGAFSCISNTAITSISLPSMTTVLYGDFVIASCSSLDSVSLPALASAFAFSLTGSPVTTLDLQALVDVGSSAGGGLTLTGLHVVTLDLSLLDSVGNFYPTSGGGLTISACPDMTTLLVPALTHLGGGDNKGALTISNNPSYLDSDAQAIAADLTNNHGWSGVFTHPGNIISGAYTGDIALYTTADVTFYSLVTDLTGNITIDPGFTGGILFPNLTTVSGDIALTGADFTSLNFPELLSIGGTLDVQSNLLTTVLLPKLATVGGLNYTQNAILVTLQFPALTSSTGGLSVYSNPLMTTLEFPVLTSCMGQVQVNDNPSLDSLDLTSLISTSGALIIFQNDSLTGLDLSEVTVVNDLNIIDNATLLSVTLTNLSSVVGNFVLGTCPMLTTLSAPALMSAGVLVGDNDSLTSISLPSMTTTAIATGIQINDNAILDSIDFSDLVTVETTLSILTNPLLTTVTVPLLATIGINSPSETWTSLYVTDNTSFTPTSLGATALPSLTRLGWLGVPPKGNMNGLTVTGNTGLTDVVISGGGPTSLISRLTAAGWGGSATVSGND